MCVATKRKSTQYWWVEWNNMFIQGWIYVDLGWTSHTEMKLTSLLCLYSTQHLYSVSTPLLNTEEKDTAKMDTLLTWINKLKLFAPRKDEFLAFLQRNVATIKCFGVHIKVNAQMFILFDSKMLLTTTQNLLLNQLTLSHGII